MTSYKKLSTQSLNKLSNMSIEDKIWLYARTCIIDQNNKIKSIIINALGTYALEETKAEIVHHLYDENSPYNFPKRYKNMQMIMNNRQSIYKKSDTYTLCAYMVYYEEFIKLAKNAKTLKQIRNAKEQAYKNVKTYIDIKSLNINYDSYKLAKTDTLLKKEYRRDLLIYLINDLQIENGFDLAKNYLLGTTYTHSTFTTPTSPTTPTNNSTKIYANQVEEYKNADGSVFYLDSDGNSYEYYEIEDCKHSKGILKATENGIIEQSQDDDFIF